MIYLGICSFERSTLSVNTVEVIYDYIQYLEICSKIFVGGLARETNSG